MPRFVKNFANIEGNTWAYLYEDGSLSIEVRTALPPMEDQKALIGYVEISSAGIKELLEVLDDENKQNTHKGIAPGTALSPTDVDG